MVVIKIIIPALTLLYYHFLQGVSVAASPVLAIVGKPSVRLSVRPSVCHTVALSENDAS